MTVASAPSATPTSPAIPAAPAFDVALAERSLPMGAVAVSPTPANQLFDLLERFKKTIVTAHHLSPQTAISYDWRLGSFFRWLQQHGVDTLAAVTYSHFEDYTLGQHQALRR